MSEDCGLMPDGFCTKIGTEECDWCPNYDEIGVPVGECCDCCGVEFVPGTLTDGYCSDCCNNNDDIAAIPAKTSILW